MNFARNFVTLRKKMNLSQEQMAERCGVSRSGLAKWESGATIPNVYMLVDIARIYGVSVDELLSSKMDDNVADEMEVINEKLDKLQEIQTRLLEVIQRDRKTDDLYLEYCKYNVDICSEENEAMSFIAKEQGEKALECNDPFLAVKYFEEALLYGDASAFSSLLSAHNEIMWIKGCDEEGNDYYSYMLEVVGKLQQYGKIVEDLIRKGTVF